MKDEQRDVVLDAYNKKYGTKGPRDYYGFPLASYRWHGFLTAYEKLLPVIEAADEYIATLESQAVAVSVSATIIRMEKKAAYLKARDTK